MWAAPSKPRIWYVVSHCYIVGRSVFFLWDRNNGVVWTKCSGLPCFPWNQWEGCMVPTGWCISPYSGLGQRHVTIWRLCHRKTFVVSKKLWLDTEWFFCVWVVVKDYVFNWNYLPCRLRMTHHRSDWNNQLEDTVFLGMNHWVEVCCANTSGLLEHLL